MEKGNLTRIEYTIGFGKANLLAFLISIPIGLVLILAFIYIWSLEVFRAGESEFSKHWLLYVLSGIVIYELIHGIVLASYTKNGIKSIRFGIKWLTPYCHCKEPLQVGDYKIGTAMPIIVLGILPSLLAILIGNGALFCFGILFTWGGAGDLIILYMLRKLDNEIVISDHPSKIGFFREVELEDVANYKPESV